MKTLNKWKTVSNLSLKLLIIIAFGASLLIQSAAGFFQGSDGMPTAPEFILDPISLLIGIGMGGLVVGIPVLARAVVRRKYQDRVQLMNKS